MNPCHSGDNLVHTRKGLIPIRDLVELNSKSLPILEGLVVVVFNMRKLLHIQQVTNLYTK